MGVDAVASNYFAAKAEWMRCKELAKFPAQRANEAIENLYEIVSQDFRKFLEELNPSLPEEERITRWSAKSLQCGPGYIAGFAEVSALEICIDIQEIGGKRCFGRPEYVELPLPAHLVESMATFVARYKIPVGIHIRNPMRDSEL